MTSAGVVRDGGVFLDLNSAFTPREMRPDLCYWSI